MIIVPPKTSLTDDFTSANQNGLNRAGTFTWNLGNGTVNPGITSNQAVMKNVTNGYYPAVMTQRAAATDTHYVSAFNVGAMSARACGLLLGCDAAFDGYAIVLIYNTEIQLGYGIGPTAGGTAQWVAKGSAPSSTATLQAWRFEKHVAENGAMYRLYCNSTLELEYTDTALTVPNGPDNRYGGIIVQRSSFANSPGWDAFSIADLYP